MTKSTRRQRDRFERLSVVLNIVTTILVVLSGFGVIAFWRSMSHYEDLSGGYALYSSAFVGFFVAILVLLATLFVHIAIRTVTYIWIGRFWR